MSTETAAGLIARSLSHTEIAHGEWTRELHAALVAAADDYIDVDATWTICIYWGVIDGAEWRVHLETKKKL